MTEETTTTLPRHPLPPVRHWPALDLKGTEFDPLLAEFMREGPLIRVQLPYGDGWAWLATRHDDVKAITEDPRFSRAEMTRRHVTRSAEHFTPRPGSLAYADRADHDRLREVVAGAFTLEATERLRPRARRILDALLDGVLREGPPADLVERVLQPFPMSVTDEIMGVPAADREQVHAWVRQIPSAPGRVGTAGEATAALDAWITDTVRARAHSTGDDVCSLLGAAVARGEISEAEAVGLAGPLQLGGEAVTHLCGQLLYVLLTRPELMTRTRERPGTRDAALDELLRHLPHEASAGLARIALEDVDLRGHRIHAGDAVYVSYLAANRDPDVFPDPERIDPDRAPHPHLAFGNGPHRCTAAASARMQLGLLVGTLLDRLPGLRLAVPADQIPWRRKTSTRGPRALPVTW